jgi:sugar O-acyltransferase (sialic acid O-acetyltransferase NeuD family)
MNELILIGGGGHCKSVIDVIEREAKWKIIGIIDQANVALESVLAYPIIGTDDDLEKLYSPQRAVLITVGQIKSSAIRQRLFEHAKKIGYQIPSIISPSANVSKHANIGQGTVIMNFVHIGPNVVIGENVIINTQAVIEHDVSVGNHCHISTGAILNGNVTVKNGVFLGSRSVCKEGITIENNAVIGMGLSVRKDIPENTVFVER